MKPTWKKYLLYGSAVMGGGIVLYMLIQTVRAKNTGFETKTLWDWMELLIIPLVLAGGAFYLQRSERAVEREIAADRQQETALQAYLDRMAELLLNEKSLKSEKVLTVARVRTLTVIRGLNSVRNGIVFRFLRDIGLAGKLDSKFFVDANLEGVDLERVDLSNINLERASLRGANLKVAGLLRANLKHAILAGANLEDAYLGEANLEHALLHSANLKRAILHSANLKHAILAGANLRDANLQGAMLQDAIVSNDRLATALSLERATMPDGTKHD
jgi:uncharacterized protein YjbI with pentapeptide repeats